MSNPLRERRSGLLETVTTRVQGAWSRMGYTGLFRKSVRMRNPVPLISFSFDDFPRSALEVGGDILGAEGIRATYYASLGLAGTHSPVGPIFSLDDLARLLGEGHELGCHTFAHCDSWSTPPSEFEASIVENRRRLGDLLPGASFRTLSYPKSGPRPHTKRRAARHYPCCRFGGQAFNADVTDRYLLAAYFLEQSRHDADAVKRIIDQSVESHGWLIFATHDVSDAPSRYGCDPLFLRDVVRHAVRSGARLLPVGEAWELVEGR